MDNLIEYPWSSYETVISEKKTKLKRDEVIEAFGNVENFIFYHNQNHDLKEIENLLIE